MTHSRRHSRKRGQATVEFALVALVTYFLLAATLEFGRLIFCAQALQDASRVAARELAVTPLPADIATATSYASLEALLNDPIDAATLASLEATDPNDARVLVKKRIYDPRHLVVDLATAEAHPQGIDGYFADMPLVNQMLRPMMVFQNIGGQETLHYAGAVVTTPSGVRVVKIPRVSVSAAPPYELTQVAWVPVIEEIPLGGGSAFSLNGPGTPAGTVAIRLNFPFQAATLSAYRQLDSTNPQLNGLEPVVTNDADYAPEPGDAFVAGPAVDGATGTYAGPAGLGRQYAMGQEVRPFRRLVSAQAIFRREVFR